MRGTTNRQRPGRQGSRALESPCWLASSGLWLSWLLVRLAAQFPEQQPHHTRGDSDVRNIEDASPQRADTDVDEVDDVAIVQHAIDQVADAAADDQRQRQHRASIERLLPQQVRQQSEQNAAHTDREDSPPPALRKRISETEKGATVASELQ